MSGATSADSGLASGVNNTTQQVGGAFGLAIEASLAASRTKGLLAAGKDQANALASGYHLGFAAATGFVLAAMVVALVILRPKQAAPTERETVEPVRATTD
jgi:hypothetical protein